MQTPLAEINKVRALPFVDDVTLSPNSLLYIVSLKYEYPDILNPDKNYLTVDANDFTAEAVIESFRVVVVGYYKREYEKAQSLLKLARGQDFGDIMNELD